MAEIKAGIGDPTKPTLSPEEEKRVDADHRPVVHGLAWSDAPTGLYLTVFGAQPTGPLGCLSPYKGSAILLDNMAVFVGVTRGKPTFSLAGHGASLELPVDLGLDTLKQRYVMDWLIDTAKEVFLGLEHPGLPDEQSAELAMWLFVTANDAINAARL